MKPFARPRYVFAFLVFNCGWLTGCQHADSQLARAGTKTPEEPTTRVTARQTADVQIALGRSLEQNGQVEQAIAAYVEAEKNDPRRADAYERLAVLYDRQGKFAESAKQYRKALELSPASAELFCDLGYSLYLQRRWVEAETALNKAVSLKPDLARAHNNLALVLARNDRPDEALRQFRLGGAAAAAAQVNLGQALTIDGRWAEARGHYESALAAEPSCERARAALHQLDRLVAAASAHRRNTTPAAMLVPPDARDLSADNEVSAADSGMARCLVRLQAPAP